ncbi:MAG: hypothetical protein WA972_12810 [Rhodococcus qingshengii]
MNTTVVIQSPWILAFPFICAALLLLFSSALSWSSEKKFREEFEAAWNDGTDNSYLLPAKFDKETIYGTMSRNSDALALPAAMISSIPSVILLVQAGTPLYDLTILLSAGLPLTSYVLIMNIPWYIHDKWLSRNGISFISLLTVICYVALSVFAFIRAR